MAQTLNTSLAYIQQYVTRDYPSDWDSRRKRVYERDNHTCQNCGASGQSVELHAHHIVPKSNGGSHDLSNLTTLCPECHNAAVGKDMGLTNRKQSIDRASTVNDKDLEFEGTIEDPRSLIERLSDYVQPTIKNLKPRMNALLTNLTVLIIGIFSSAIIALILSYATVSNSETVAGFLSLTLSEIFIFILGIENIRRWHSYFEPGITTTWTPLSVTSSKKVDNLAYGVIFCSFSLLLILSYFG